MGTELKAGDNDDDLYDWLRCITLLRMLMMPLYKATAQYCPSLVHEHDIARELIFPFEIPFWSTSHKPVKTDNN